MIKHLLKLVWNRKRVNFLITIEILISFLVLFGVLLLGFYYLDNYRQPLGFDYQNVWAISIDMNMVGGVVGDNDHTPEQVKLMQQLIPAIRSFDEVESVAGSLTTPYSNSSWTSTIDDSADRPKVTYEVNQVTDSFNQVMNLKLVQGRWFNQEDDGEKLRPVVINQHMSRIIFGHENPIGKLVDDNMRVVGVIEEFRKGGEFAAPGNYLFQRKNIDNVKERPPQQLVIKLRPGITAAFEEKLSARMQNIAKDWSFEIDPLAEKRETSLRKTMTPLIAIAIVAGFLLVMVALGLTGVLWQNVTQRTKEIGLRRAKGATARNIYTQIIGELLIIASFGLLIGVGIALQFPLLDLVGYISNRVYFVSLIFALAIIYLLTIACSLYPSRMATKVQPAQALHYE